MPWRKYKPKEGKHGPVYHVATGVNVRQDARGKWIISIEKGGERKNKTVGVGREALTKAIKAAEVLAEKLGAMAQGQPAAQDEKSAAPDFAAYSMKWLEGNAGRWSPLTCVRYEEILRLHVLPNKITKGKAVDGFERADIKEILRGLLVTHSPATVEAVHSVICGIFDDAIDDKIITSNPARNLLKKILPPIRMRNVKGADPFNYDERDLFLKTASRIATREELLILRVMAYAGFRSGESLAMQADNLDLRQMTYHVDRSFRRGVFSKPKFGKSRTVDLPEFLVEELKEHILAMRKASLKSGKGGVIDLLFVDPKEGGKKPFSQRIIQGLVAKVCRKAGLRVRNPHDLRHTYATTMLMAHQSPAYVMRQLGHSSISITVDIYGHWFPNEGREDLEKALQGPVRNPDENRIFPHML